MGRLALSLLGLGLLLAFAAVPGYAEEGTTQQLPQLDLGGEPLLKPMAEPEVGSNPPAKADAKYEAGVKAYRDGDYAQAGKVFALLHRQAPENTRFTYYLAITEAQLGCFQQAKKLYSEILTLDPNGETATLAKEGLKYLPPETSLDLPPRFNGNAGSGGGVVSNQAGSAPASGPANTGNAPPAISQQDLMAWQMLMGQGSGNNSGGFNPMGGFMPGMMTGMPNGANGNASMDPSVMSTMLMNQMMQNMNLGGESGENR